MSNIAIRLLNGYAHMWFLPMLLWTFLITWCVLQIDRRWLRWCIIIGLCGISFLSLPYEIDRAFYYIIYFYAGYEALVYMDKLKEFATPKSIAVQWLIFVSAFVLLTIALEDGVKTYPDGSKVVKILFILSKNLSTKVYGFLGILALYSTSVYYTSKHHLSSATIKIGSYCFGVYLYQQFILQALYHHTQLPIMLGNNLLPWVGFVITLIVSLILSYLTKLTYWGRKLI